MSRLNPIGTLDDERMTILVDWHMAYPLSALPKYDEPFDVGIHENSVSIHGVPESDNLRSLIAMYMRTGQAIYRTRVESTNPQGWLPYHITPKLWGPSPGPAETSPTYRHELWVDEGTGHTEAEQFHDHFWAEGLIDYFEQFGGADGNLAKTEARALIQRLQDTTYTASSPFFFPYQGTINVYGGRGPARQLIAACRVAEYFPDAVPFRDFLIDQLYGTLLYSPTWEIYFNGEGNTFPVFNPGSEDIADHIAAYNAGYRSFVSWMGWGLIPMALIEAHKALGPTGQTQSGQVTGALLATRLTAMANRCALDGLDPTYIYTGREIVYDVNNPSVAPQHVAAVGATSVNPFHTVTPVNLLAYVARTFLSGAARIAMLDRAKLHYVRSMGAGFYSEGTINVTPGGGEERLVPAGYVARLMNRNFQSSEGYTVFAPPDEWEYAHELFPARAKPAFTGGIWTRVLGSDLIFLTPDPIPPSDSGNQFGSGAYSYGGACYDCLRNKYIRHIGGGHRTYGGNDSDEFDPVTLQWAQITDSSPNCQVAGLPDNTYISDVYADGTPPCRHAYGNAEYAPNVGCVIMLGGNAISLNSGGLAAHTVFWLDPAAKTWTRKADGPQAINGVCFTRYHNGYIYVLTATSTTGGGPSSLLRYDPLAELAGGNPWFTIAASVQDADIYSQITVDDLREQIWVYSIPSAGHDVADNHILQRFSLSGVGGPITFTGDPIPRIPNIGMDYDPTCDRIVLWSQEMGPEFYVLDPVTLIGTRVAVTGTAPPTSPPGAGDGYWNNKRIRRINDGRYVYHPAASEDVYIFTPPWAPLEVGGSGLQLYSVAPASGTRGQVVDVTLNGNAFDPLATVTISGTGIAISNVVRVSATVMTARFTIASNATFGVRTVTVTNQDLTDAQSTFSVTAPPIVATHMAPATIDRMGPGTTGPDGVADVQMAVSGVRTDVAATKVRWTHAPGQGTGTWETPSAVYWQIWIEELGGVLTGPTVLPASFHAYFQPFGNLGPYAVRIEYADGSASVTTSILAGSTVFARIISGGTIALG